MRFIFVILMFAFYLKLPAQCKLDYSNYEVLFEDFFDGVDIDTKIWKFTPDDPYGGWRDEYYEESQVELLDGGGIRLIAEKLANPITLKENGRTVYFKSGMLKTLNGYILDGSYDWTNPNGYAYGMFEFSAKLPESSSVWDVWPALWLYSGATEIDILDNGIADHANWMNSGVIDWSNYPSNHKYNDWLQLNKYYPGYKEFSCYETYNKGDYVNYKGLTYLAEANIELSCCGTKAKKLLSDLSKKFNTYTAVWTPDQITFFFNQRELYTLDKKVIKNLPENNADIYITLQMFKNAPQTEYHMDIQYVKVFKPLNDDYTLSYKADKEWMSYDIHNMIKTINPPQVHSSFGSIVTHKNNPNELFYRGNNNKLYRVIKFGNNVVVPETKWAVLGMEYNYDNYEFSTVSVMGELNFHPMFNYIIYKGGDDRLQYFAPDINGGYYHWWIDDDFFEWEYNSAVSNKKDVVSISPNGNIVYKGKDNKIHIMKLTKDDWIHFLPDYEYKFKEFVLGNVNVDSYNNVIYTGYDNHVQMFLYSNGEYNNHRSLIDNNQPLEEQKVFPEVGGGITLGDGDIYFRGNDDKLHRLYHKNTSNYIHEIVPHKYNDNLGYENGDLILGNLRYSNNDNRIIYSGYDGRIQFFEKQSESSKPWKHYWYDDYWNSNEFVTYSKDLNGGPSNSPSIDIGANGNIIYYTDDDAHLRYFIYDGCELLNPECESEITIKAKKEYSEEHIASSVKNKENYIRVSNNIFYKNILVEVKNFENIDFKMNYEIRNSLGQRVMYGSLFNNYEYIIFFVFKN